MARRDHPERPRTPGTTKPPRVSPPDPATTGSVPGAALRGGTCSNAVEARGGRRSADTHATAARAPARVAALEPEPHAPPTRRRRATRCCRAGTARVLEGVPITVKDWIDVGGFGPITGSSVADPATAGLRTMRLRSRAYVLVGAVVVGITHGTPADSPLHGRTHHPHDASRRARGSSSGVGASRSPPAQRRSGSAATPAGASGSRPRGAAVCGLKPSFDRGNRSRATSRALGELSRRPYRDRTAGRRSVDDLALVLRCTAGPDGLDAGAFPVPLA